MQNALSSRRIPAPALRRRFLPRTAGALAAALSSLLLSLASAAPAADAGFAAAADQAGASDSRPCAIRMGIGTFAEPNPNYGILAPTAAAVQAAFPEKRVCVKQLSTAELDRLASAGALDLFISSSGLYRRFLNRGLRDIASVMGPHISNPNEAEGTAIVARRDRLELSSIESLRGLKLAANMPEGFTGYLAGLREIAEAGHDPEGFFSAVDFVGHNQAKVLDEVLAGRADIGFVRACTLEDLIAAAPQYQNAFRIIHPRVDAGFGCLHSTALYPSWTAVVTKSMNPADAARAAAAILQMPPTKEGLRWGIATDFSQVDRLYQTLEIGPYAFLRTWTLSRFWEEYKTWIVAAMLLIAGLAVHGWRTEALVKKRTAELERSMAAERGAQRRAAELSERMQTLQKAGVIGQISSLIAHELGQPVGAVRLYAHGLLRALEAGGDKASIAQTVERIDRQAARAQTIIEHVRSYAKSKGSRRQTVDFTALLAEAVKNFSLTSRGGWAKVTLENAPSPLWVRADPLELELAVVNFLKNAAEAARSAADPQILVVLESAPGAEALRLTVADNGPALSDDFFRKLSAPFDSTKSDGLGLGLSICRSIAEAHGGAVSFVREGPLGGLAVEFSLPLCGENPDDAAPARN